jgi:hypothetical protein
MLDFRPKGRSRNYLARGEQRKLLGLVFAVGLVLFLIEQAANPNRWAWLWQAALGQAAGRQAAAGGGDPARFAKVEQPPELRRRQAAKDEFIAENGRKEDLPAHKQFFPGVDRELLAAVRDDTVFRSSEAGAFFHLLGILKDTPEATLEESSIGSVSFTQLFAQPKEFRGDLVTLEGTVLRALPKTAAKNEYGIRDYHMLVVEPRDRAYGVIVYALELPPDFPTGEKLHEPVSLTGFFYKRWAHLSEDKEIMTWPLLLSKTVRWRPVAAEAPAADAQANMKNLLGGLAVAVLASLVVVVFVFSATRRKTQFKMPHSRTADFQRLADEQPVPDVRQQLAELARQEQ